MESASSEFQRIVTAVLTRFYGQHSRPPPVAQIARFASQLDRLVAERGLPRPLADHEYGEPGGMDKDECARLVERVMGGLDDALLGEVAKQCVKACFHPEFKVCRDSFREVKRDGSCRRQELERVRNRISGTHCVDCPHWVALTPAQHVQYLQQEWRGDPREFAAHRDIFLPEDFRAFRRWLHAAARRGTPGA